MAHLTITEYASVGYTGSNKNQFGIFAAAGQILAEQNISLTASSQQCSALNAATTLVELCSDTDCYLAFGTSPTAQDNFHYLPAKTVRYYAVGAPTLIAAIT